MSLLFPTPLRSLAAAATATATAAAAASGRSPLLFRRRAELAGNFLFVCLSTVAGVRSLHSSASARMESTLTTVPSIVVYVTVPNQEAGKKLAGSIISEKLAACVNIVPGGNYILACFFSAATNAIRTKISNSYVVMTHDYGKWCGKVVVGLTAAYQNTIAVGNSLFLSALEWVLNLFTGGRESVPEVIALPIKGGNLKYLEWLKNSTREN
ncbi:hypothetical protein ABZP36_030568 [Zizania latifolia]